MPTDMRLGNFSVSLAVKVLAVSRAFYEKLGGFLILKNGSCIIGLFQGMFEDNILTFNPGWDENAQETDSFTDIRDLQKSLKADGITLTSEADETTTGPASFTLNDPDGNAILVDQHR
jgi:catechol 2,3-dioxygenase-like lactoylglutathione lyase family enzyme